ncbi:MAG: hypothetical protein QXT63_08680 [Thermoplasmata archaeon]
MNITLEVLYSPIFPFGLEESRKIAKEFGLGIIEYDPSQIDETDLSFLPNYISEKILSARLGKSGILFYGYTFVNGIEFQWLPWLSTEDDIRREIAKIMLENNNDLHKLCRKVSYRKITKEDILDGRIDNLIDSYEKLNFSRNVRSKENSFLMQSICGDAPGIIAFEGNRSIGSLIFLPKRIARKILFLTSPNDEDLDKTLIVVYLDVDTLYKNTEVEKEIVRYSIEQAKKAGYKRIEACTSERFFYKSAPFLSNAFEIEVLDSGEPFHCQILARPI